MYELYEYVPLAQLDRASDYGSEGREFESSAARQNKTTTFYRKLSFYFVKFIASILLCVYT